MGLASPGGSELAELLPGPVISCTEAVLLLPLPPQPPLPEVGWLLSLRSGFVSVIISIVICPLSDPLPGRARKHPSVSVFNGAPSSSSLEKKKAKQAHNESDVSLLASPLISPSHFSHGPISASSLLFVWDVAWAQHPGESGRLLSESAGVQRWERLIGLLWPLRVLKRLQGAWPPDTRAWDQLQAELEVHEGHLGGGRMFY